MARRRQNGSKKKAAAPQSRGGLPLEATPLENLQQLNLHAAGIDIGSRQHVVAVPSGADPDDRPVTVRTFGTFTADLQALAKWLQRCGITTVAMESTGVYWIAAEQLLAEQGFDVKLVQPAQLKNAPGRKTDVQDCQWIQQLHTYGLLVGSFIPPEAICVLRSYSRQRERLVRQAAEHIQHMQKALTEMNVQLHHVLDDITGATGLRILDAILGGERDPQRLAELRHHNCKRDVTTIALALQGNWREDHLFALRQALDLFRYFHEKLREVDERLEAHLRTFMDRSEGRELPPPRTKQKRSRSTASAEQPPSAATTRVRARKKRNSELSFELRPLLFRMTGVDLTSIDGIGEAVALNLLSEIGTDMSAWRTDKHFCSWLALCPGNHKRGGQQRRSRSRTRPSANRAAYWFRLAAQSLWGADCALGAYYRRMKALHGAPKAIVATAHKLARLVYRLLKEGRAYEDRGAAWYEAQFREQKIKGLRRQAEALGLQLVSVP